MGNHRRATGAMAGPRNPRWAGGVSADPMRYRRRARARAPERDRARELLRNAVRRGEVVRQPCHCGEPAQAHHADYSRMRWAAPVVAALAIALAACGDDVQIAPPAPATCDQLEARAVARPDVGECLVAGVDLVVPGVSYRAADDATTWVQAVVELDGDLGVVVRPSIWSAACEWRPCLVERTPATGEP